MANKSKKKVSREKFSFGLFSLRAGVLFIAALSFPIYIFLKIVNFFYVFYIRLFVKGGDEKAFARKLSLDMSIPAKVNDVKGGK